jgi:hypothetical protein
MTVDSAATLMVKAEDYRQTYEGGGPVHTCLAMVTM